ncbi:MAG: GAP1-N2 domain-containing protein [Thermoguttaceae bacterium]
MSIVEQAIYTSAKTDHSHGYQVIARSPGLQADDSRELAAWCPSHDSLLETGEDAMSVNFHSLPSGAYCVSRTVPAGWEYSGRGGARVYTHCLIVQPETLKRFANNPFALLQAALAMGALEIRHPLPKRLEPLSLVGGATPVDQTLLMRLSNNPGPREMAILLQAALDAPCLAFSGRQPKCELIAGLFNCVPPACRPFFSFSTGLKFSLRRPFHLIALPNDPGERRWLTHHNNICVLDLTLGDSFQTTPLDGWAQFIERALHLEKTHFLAAELAKRHFDLKPDDLPALGLQLLENLEELDACSLGDSAPTLPATSAEEGRLKFDAPDSGDDRISADNISLAGEINNESREIQQAHAAHRRFEKSQIQAAKKPAHLLENTPSSLMKPDSPEVLEKLELLDDLVYDAISGRPGVLDQLQIEWPKIHAELGNELLAESREQYLRYAMTIWESCLENETMRNPSHAIKALDVLCLLFNE